MVTVELATRLREAGLVWSPTAGDAFAVPDRDLDDEVFVLSPMVVEPVRLPDGVTVLGFNGTTEWALDSLEVQEAVWLPREDQLTRTARSTATRSCMYRAFMVALQIRDVPDDVRDTLAEQARGRGQSLQAFLLALLTDEARRAGNLVALGRFGDRDDGSRLSATELGELLDQARAERETRPVGVASNAR